MPHKRSPAGDPVAEPADACRLLMWCPPKCQGRAASSCGQGCAVGGGAAGARPQQSARRCRSLTAFRHGHHSLYESPVGLRAAEPALCTHEYRGDHDGRTNVCCADGENMGVGRAPSDANAAECLCRAGRQMGPAAKGGVGMLSRGVSCSHVSTPGPCGGGRARNTRGQSRADGRTNGSAAAVMASN